MESTKKFKAIIRCDGKTIPVIVYAETEIEARFKLAYEYGICEILHFAVFDRREDED
jgi:hypothetical protein